MRMTSKPWTAARRLVPLSCSLLSIVLGMPTQAANEAAAMPADATSPVEELTELDEVRVRGKLVANAVIRTENLVFRLYNKLNEDNRYDVHCGDIPRRRDSLTMLRVCLPEFVRNYAIPLRYPASFAPWGFGTPACGRVSSGVDGNGNMYSMASCPPAGSGFSTLGSTSRYYYSNTALLPAPQSYPVVVPAERRTEFSQNMMRVLNSDAELKDLATQLADMYREVDRVQARYAVLQQERRAANKARLEAARERARSRGYELRPPHPRAP